MRLPRYADLPIRAKLLAPFLILMIVWGGFGSYVLARGRAGEAHGRATARLAESLDGARARFAEAERSLLEAARLGAHTQGVGTALVGGDVPKLKRLLLPLVVNAELDALAAVDPTGRVVIAIEMDGSTPRTTTSGQLTVPGVLSAARGERDERGDMWVALTDEMMHVAGSVPGGGVSTPRSVGAIVASYRLRSIASTLLPAGDARVVIFSRTGRELASTTDVPIGFRATDGGMRVSHGEGDGQRELLYAPLDARGARVGTIAIVLPAASALGDVGRTATILSLLVGCAVIAAVGIGLLTARAITRPVGSLLEATRALERGELSARATISSRDEVGTLATTFNQMAHQLQASHEELERKVRDRTAELERVNDELERASAAKSAFLATMSHELRTPLNAIIGFADMLSDPTFGRPSTSTTRELSTNILHSGRHLLTLINDVLDLAKVEAGRIDVTPEPTELDDVLTEVLNVVSPLAHAKELDLAIDGDDDIVVMADPARLRQILFNLVANAIKFTPPGGEIVVTTTAGERAVTIAVTDNGPGLAEDEARRIFEPFERGEGAKRVEGTGLGLALARHLVEAQRGRIWVDTAPGRGSTFSFTVPLALVRRAVADRRRAV